MTDLCPPDWTLPSDVAARLAGPADAAPALLPDAERGRLAAYGSASRRQQALLGRVAARTLAAERLGLDAVRVPLKNAPDGAPEIPGLHVSIAHTSRGGDTAALAAIADRPIGVDLERVRPRRPDLWTRILQPAEYPLLDALGGPTDTVQTLLWALKEAVLKGQRTGFRAGGRSVRLMLDVDGLPERGVAAATASASGGWRVAFGREQDLWLAVAWPEAS